MGFHKNVGVTCDIHPFGAFPVIFRQIWLVGLYVYPHISGPEEVHCWAVTFYPDMGFFFLICRVNLEESKSTKQGTLLQNIFNPSDSRWTTLSFLLSLSLTITMNPGNFAKSNLCPVFLKKLYIQKHTIFTIFTLKIHHKEQIQWTCFRFPTFSFSLEFCSF